MCVCAASVVVCVCVCGCVASVVVLVTLTRTGQPSWLCWSLTHTGQLVCVCVCVCSQCGCVGHSNTYSTPKLILQVFSWVEAIPSGPLPHLEVVCDDIMTLALWVPDCGHIGTHSLTWAENYGNLYLAASHIIICAAHPTNV